MGGMVRSALLLLSLVTPALAATGTDSVRIYRCTTRGSPLTLQSAPCSSGRQQVLEMQRPQDPPGRANPAPQSRAAPAPELPIRDIRAVSVQPPQPMYECVSADGKRYTHDTAEGDLRLLPIWVYGHPLGPLRPRPGPRPASPLPAHRPDAQAPPSTIIVPSPSVWVRDQCQALPQREVCTRLNDRRWALIKRYNSAMSGERKQLTREQHAIEERMDRDCNGV